MHKLRVGTTSYGLCVEHSRELLGTVQHDSSLILEHNQPTSELNQVEVLGNDKSNYSFMSGYPCLQMPYYHVSLGSFHVMIECALLTGQI